MTALQIAPSASHSLVAARSAKDRSDDAFTLEHFRQWASRLILDTGEPWVLEPFQERFIVDLFAGYPEAWLLVPEGNTKTTTLAGISLYHAEHRPFGQVPVAAASREQAEICYRQAEGFVLRSDYLHELVHSDVQAAKGKNKVMVPRFVCLEGYRRINHAQGGRIQVFAADDRTGDGIIPTLGVIDEPHRQRNLSLYRTWAGKLAKRSGQLVAISTSGEPGSDFELTLERIRKSADTVGREGSFTRYTSRRVVLHEWALPYDEDPDDIEAVKRANPFSGITVEMLAEKRSAPTMTAHHWLRFVCNRPTRDDDMWLGPDGPAIWNALLSPHRLVEKAETWAGVDMAMTHDTAAVVAMQMRPDGRYHAVARIWTPTPDRPIDPTDVMQYIRGLADAYDLKAVSYDPRLFDVPAKYLEDEGIRMFKVSQSVERMTPAVGGLYEAIIRGRITHDGDDMFTTQVMNAVPRFNDSGFTLAKSKSHGKIDSAVALALAFDRIQRPEETVDEILPFVMMGRR